MKAACYLRTSTTDQTTDNQRIDVEALAKARGFEPVVYVEQESALKRRPVYERMLDDVRRGQVQAVAVWSLDRLHRSMQRMVNDVLELDHLGVRVLSVRESWLDNAGAARPLLLSVFGWVAQFERERLVERTKAGLERARREGKRIGRPPISPVLMNAAKDLVSRGTPVRQAARAKGIPEASLRRFLTKLAAP